MADRQPVDTPRTDAVCKRYRQFSDFNLCETSLREHARQLERELAEAKRDGWVFVPKEPTEAMLDAGIGFGCRRPPSNRVDDLAAALDAYTASQLSARPDDARLIAKGSAFARAFLASSLAVDALRDSFMERL